MLPNMGMCLGGGGLLFVFILLFSLGLTFLGFKDCEPLDVTLSMMNILLYSVVKS